MIEDYDGQCDRPDCGNECVKLILDGQGQICDQCYDELVQYRKTWPNEMPINEVWDRIECFMESTVGSYKMLHDEEILEEFNRIMK